MPRVIRPIRGFPGYLIGSDGSVWSKGRLRGKSDGKRGTESYISEVMKKMTPRDLDGRYWTVALRKNGKYHYFLVHRLVLETFVGPCPEGMECCHKDDNGKNNNRSNLYWGTRQQNVQDMIKNGRFNCTAAAAMANRGKHRSMEVRAKIKKAHEGMRHSLVARTRIAASHWSKGPNAAEIGAKIAAKKKGRTLTEEHKAKISASGKGKSGRPRIHQTA